MLGTPEIRVRCTVTATTPGTSFTLTPEAGSLPDSGGLGITTIVVNTTANPNRCRVGEKVDLTLNTMSG